MPWVYHILDQTHKGPADPYAGHEHKTHFNGAGFDRPVVEWNGSESAMMGLTSAILGGFKLMCFSKSRALQNLTLRQHLLDNKMTILSGFHHFGTT